MRYSEEELNFLRDNRGCMTIPILTKAFNEHFGKDRSENAIGVKCRKMHLIVGNRNQQHRGWVSWTSGLSADELKSHYKDEESFNKGKFKAGERSMAFTYQVGDEVVRGKTRNSSYVYVKISDDLSVPPEKQWMPKHRWLWEQAFGKIPAGYSVIFADGNQMNVTLDNLRAVPADVQGRIRQRQIDPSQIDLAIKIAELDAAIKTARRK